mmetsp:Transcript_20018/g.49965  ORF Transcript_20018/g.49965 Transcript_20018/m.49965 type:complete len:255 (-) Transcript_20018:286-1050(-)
MGQIPPRGDGDGEADEEHGECGGADCKRLGDAHLAAEHARIPERVGGQRGETSRGHEHGECQVEKEAGTHALPGEEAHGVAFHPSEGRAAWRGIGVLVILCGERVRQLDEEAGDDPSDGEAGERLPHDRGRAEEWERHDEEAVDEEVEHEPYARALLGEEEQQQHDDECAEQLPRDRSPRARGPAVVHPPAAEEEAVGGERRGERDDPPRRPTQVIAKAGLVVQQDAVHAEEVEVREGRHRRRAAARRVHHARE